MLAMFAPKSYMQRLCTRSQVGAVWQQPEKERLVNYYTIKLMDVDLTSESDIPTKS
jgi:hypothetical protein